MAANPSAVDLNGARSPAAGVVATGNAEQHLTFEIAGELFAIPILAVHEIRSWEKVSRIPNSAPYVLGVINLRGEIVPVIDVRARLGLDAIEMTANTVVIVVRIDTGVEASVTVGCVVDAVSDVADIDVGAITAPPAICGSVDGHFVRGIASVEARLAVLPDLARLIQDVAG